MWVEGLALLTGLLLSMSALVSGLRTRRLLDWLYVAATLPFACLAGLWLLARSAMLDPVTFATATRLTYQLMILGVTAFLIVPLRGGRPLQRALLTLQALAGLALGAWPSLGPLGWEIFNIACSATLVAMLAHALWRYGATRGWMMLLAAITALGVMLNDLVSARGAAIPVTWAQLFYLPILSVLWLTLTQRQQAGKRQPKADDAARRERQRLAQEVHDGVGSHLTTLISALDMGSPQERITAGALRECLTELKLLVDGADQDASALALLASLRYRMQPLLEAAGITLHWQVADEEELEQVVGPPARDMLRIAQESLANAVRHSGASEVMVTVCRQRARHLVMLEVTDNGRGLPPAPPPAATDRHAASCGVGKGLAGMRQRAERLGGELRIDAAPGGGTRVTLLVPLQRLHTAAHAGAA